MMHTIFTYKGKEHVDDVESKPYGYCVKHKGVYYVIKHVNQTHSKNAKHSIWSKDISYLEDDTWKRLSPQKDAAFISYLMTAVEKYLEDQQPALITDDLFDEYD